MRLRRLYVLMVVLSLLSISLVSFVFVTRPTRHQFNIGRVKYNDAKYYNDNDGQNGISVKMENLTTTTDTKADNDNNNDTTLHDNKLLQIPVLVIAAKRVTAITNHLQQLTRLRPSASQFPIIVSQDGDSSAVTDAIAKFVRDAENVQLIHHQQSSNDTKTDAYYHISQHYKFALSEVFFDMGFSVAIVTEDDLDIADDFFSYFAALRHLLFVDPTIWCVSAWNDNGNPSIVDWAGGQHKLWRTDFFPGLGWMLKAETWQELVEKWPDAYWDDWLRRPDVRKDRVCIRPEQSRTLHNLQVAGKGASGALYKSFLSSIRLPERRVNFGTMDLGFLRKNAFDRWLSVALGDGSSIEVPLQILLLQNSTDNLSAVLRDGAGPKHKSVKVIYKDPREFRQLAKKFNLMADIRSGMARTAYYGVVPFRHQGIQLFAVHTSLLMNASSSFNTTTKMDIGARKSSDIYATEWDLKSKFLDFAETFCVPKKWTGNCDPYDPAMRAWFRTKGWTKRLESWLPVTVF